MAEALFRTCFGFTCYDWFRTLGRETAPLHLWLSGEKKSRQWGSGWGQPLHDFMQEVAEREAGRWANDRNLVSGRRSENTWNDIKEQLFSRGIEVCFFCSVWYHSVAVLMKSHDNHRLFDVSFSLSFSLAIFALSVSACLNCSHARWKWNTGEERKCFPNYK